MSAKNLSWSTRATGRPSTFIAAVVIVLLWAITGPLFTTGVTGSW